MKKPCKHCGAMPKYKYIGRYTKSNKRLVTLECSGCGKAYAVCDSDPTALKHWNDAN